MNINSNIKAIFKETKHHPIFYIESGSRLWGFESPDSDYDVRGFHIVNKNEYFDYKKHKDIIEIMNGDFDFVSYDVDKMFSLLVNSNPTVLEWLRSNIIYLNNFDEFEQFKDEVIKHFNYKALFHHYLSLAINNFSFLKNGKKFNYKKTLYAIRSLLSAELATRKTMPPLLITELFKQFDKDHKVIKLAKICLEEKKKRTEKEEVTDQKQRSEITKILTDYIDHLDNISIEKSGDKTKLSNILSQYAIDLKKRYYS